MIETFYNQYNTIYAIGDLHGDIIPLIICLRDCCKVIKKKKDFNFNQKKIDDNMEELLNMEYNNLDYKDDLNYEWCGDNKTAVVLCGDILDNTRGPIYKKPGEYPYEEAKILKFINAINKQAIKKEGKIFKILGNHDINNLNGKFQENPSYISNYAKNYEGYKTDKNTSRINFFYKGNPGAKLLGEDNAYAFIKIRDFIFVHGGISNNLINVKNLEQLNTSLNDYINNPNNKTIDVNSSEMEKEILLSPNGIVHDRFFGFKTSKNKHDENKVCDVLYGIFKKLCQDMEKNKIKCDYNTDSQNMKLVIGHCMQNGNTKTFNKSYSEIIKENSSIVEYGGDISNIKHGGITISCSDNNNFKKPSIFRVDVGLSRGFNFNYKDTFYDAKIPQVLKIVYKENSSEPIISIVKSTKKNIEIHMPINSIAYHSKYIKYKKKYYKIKDMIGKLNET